MNINNPTYVNQNVVPEGLITNSTFNEKVKQFLTKEEIEKIFIAADISYRKIVDISDITFINEDRVLVRVNAKAVEKNRRLNLLVSIQFGHPTWEQFIEATYHNSGRIDKIFIVYDDSGIRDTTTPIEGVDSIECLVHRNNRCGLETYLVRAEGLMDPSLMGKFKEVIHYHLECEPDDSNGEFLEPFMRQHQVLEILPTRRQIQESEFWIGYYLPVSNRDSSIFDITDEDIYQKFAPGYSLSHNLRTEAAWNDDGLHVRIVADEASGVPDALKWIWDNMKTKLQDAYQDSVIELTHEAEKPASISIKVNQIPMNELIAMPSEDKEYYAELILGEEYKLVDLAEELIGSYDEAHTPIAMNS